MSNPIFNHIRQLILDKRITGATPALALDGEHFLLPEDDVVDPVDAIEYDESGFSTERSPWGGVMVKGVEDVRAKLLATGRTKEVEAANALPQYFVLRDNIAQMEPKAEFTAAQNANYVSTIRAWGLSLDDRAIATMTEYSPMYYDKGTKNPNWNLMPSGPVDRVPGGSNPGAAIPNHRIVIDSWTSDELGEWASKWAANHIAGTYDPGAEVLGL